MNRNIALLLLLLVTLAVFFLFRPLHAQTSIKALQCTLTVSDPTSPDGLSGWRRQLYRNQGTSHGSADSSLPYADVPAKVSAGSFTLSSLWTKSGKPNVTRDLGVATCLNGVVSVTAAAPTPVPVPTPTPTPTPTPVPPPPTSTTALTPADFSLLGYYDVQTAGNDSSWGQAFTHRYVNGELRFLTLNLGGTLAEFRLGPIALGGRTTDVTKSWNLNQTGALNNFVSLNFEQAKNRLWITSAEDYVAEYRSSNITTLTLNDDGTVSNVHRVSLQGVNAKHVYGGAVKVSDAFAASLGFSPCPCYLVGFGGYTSLVAQGGGASIGPTAYLIRDPASYPNGTEIPSSAFKVILDTTASRGVRKTFPVNYFDSGDPRPNPPSRPTVPPLATAGYLSPNTDGLGWMVWGDSYYNTGMWIERNGKAAFASIASMCKGSCWYQSSTLEFDGRQFELHLWDPATLGSGPLTRPTSMTELVLPRGDMTTWGGNSPIGNIGGATYDATTGRLYLYGIAHGPDVFTNRIYVYQVR